MSSPEEKNKIAGSLVHDRDGLVLPKGFGEETILNALFLDLHPITVGSKPVLFISDQAAGDPRPTLSSIFATTWHRAHAAWHTCMQP